MEQDAKRLTAIAVIGVLALAGCGSSDKSSATVDTSTVESGIKQQFSSSGADVTKVDCPSGQKSKAGATFNCNLTWSNSATGKVKVTQGSGRHYTYELVSGSVQVPGSSVDKALEKDLAQQGAPNATVDCPQNIIVKTDTTVTCNVSGASGHATGQITFAFSSEAGTIDPASVKTG